MPSTERRQELLLVYERHHGIMLRADTEGIPAQFVNVDFSLNGSVDSYFQFSGGLYNATQLDEERKEAFRRIVEEEDLELETEEAAWMTASDYGWSPDEAARVTGRILEEVYGVSIEDIERVEEVGSMSGMDHNEMEDQLEAVKEFLGAQDNVTVFEVTNQPFVGFEFEKQTLQAFAERGVDVGVDEFYVIEDRNESGNLDQVGVCFFHDNRPHTFTLKSFEQSAREGTDQTQTGDTMRYRGFYEESDEEQALKQEIADELLTEYDEYLSDEERFELENQLEYQRVTYLMRLENRVKEEARIDPEEEKRLAHLVYNDDRFNNQFNQMDTEMLLADMGVEFDEDRVRISEVHTRAKSLIKING